MAEIQLKGITKRVEDVIAVDSLNLNIHDLRFALCVGPSGCGKTTTLRSIGGLEHPEEADVLMDGKRINYLSSAYRDVGFVFSFMRCIRT